MAKEELIKYIEESLAKGESRQTVRSRLSRAGWPSHEIDSAFDMIKGEGEPAVPRYTRSESHKNLFNLQEGERIVFETRPLKGLLWYLLISSFIAVFILMIFFGNLMIFSVFAAMMFGASGMVAGVALSGFLFFVLALLIAFVVAKRRYNMRYYWITDKRIIVKKGFIGYSINSIPHERISDVLISRSLLERLFGFGSLHIQTLAGQYTMRGRMGAEGNLMAIPDPEKNQELIFRLVNEKRKREHLTM
jgi:membrane protein YdbS with pleckstrin-like domain